MSVSSLFDKARKSATDRNWSQAVELARAGGVAGVSDDGREIVLKVKTRGRPTPYEVTLWPPEDDCGCECGREPGCVHVCAALIALQQARTAAESEQAEAPAAKPAARSAAAPPPAPAARGPARPAPPARQNTMSGLPGPLPVARKSFQVQLRYRFRTKEQSLVVDREVVWPDGRTQPLERPLAQTDMMADTWDAHVETVLVGTAPGPLSADKLRKILTLLDPRCQATLDGRPIRISPEPVLFRARLTDDGAGFKVGLVRPTGIDQLFQGAVIVGDVMRPTSYGDLSKEQRDVLVKGVHFSREDVSKLVTDVLPRLEEQIPVDIVSERLPRRESLVPRIEIQLEEEAGGLRVWPVVVYGDPIFARIRQGVLRQEGEIVPARDLGAERAVAHAFEKRLTLRVDVQTFMLPQDAAVFLQQRLPLHEGPVSGRVDANRFQVLDSPLEPIVQVVRLPTAEGGGFKVEVDFRGPIGRADPVNVLRAWQTGRPLVALVDGGYAPLPEGWMQQHGALLMELLDARDARGRVDRAATHALVELLEDTSGEVPEDLDRLRAFLAGEDGVPDPVPPVGLNAELRHYQLAGYQWLRFLRDMDLHGILADDMGLGKTVQTLAVLSDTPGPHLVIAPTSVIENWAREIERFAPGLSVSRYHGAGRQFEDRDVTLTSYALLRLDKDLLAKRKWVYVVLDEAQAIKNPESLTARAARQLDARHRLALSGTPVENRLSELWSIFRFLMPGLLGAPAAFRERFEKPIENGDARARSNLRRRIRPYVLRRLKQQVATELPSLTEMVVRCEMGDEQRKVYEAVRLAMRNDVLALLDDRGVEGASLQVLEALLRMRQAACDPSLLPAELAAEAGSCKLDQLEELLTDIVCDGHKTLIFSQWTTLLDRVEPRLKSLGLNWVRLDGSTRDRQGVIDKFQDPNGPPVFLLSLKAGGFGLNLTAADYVVHLDPWWNPAVERQATDRAHRIGQNRPVVSCKLIATGTVEERILDLQEAKKALADAALGGDGAFLRTLSATDLRALFDA